MLIDWNGPLQTDRTSSLKEGPKWYAGHQEYDRVHMTKTPYYSTFRSLPGIFRVTNQQNNRPFLGGGVLPYAEDTVGLFYSLPTEL